MVRRWCNWWKVIWATLGNDVLWSAQVFLIWNPDKVHTRKHHFRAL